MKSTLLRLLVCPACHTDLTLSGAVEKVGGELETGTLVCSGCARTFPVLRGIPRFVPLENYARSFGLQWNRFRQTQLDSFSGLALSRQRFFESTGWTEEELRGKLVLDAGCGAGRFAEIPISCGAEVVAVDYSDAVEACAENLRGRGNLHVVQADLNALPFRRDQFDFVYCLGVLQHTPDVAQAFSRLPLQVKPGGKLAVDVYPRLLRNLLWSKYWLRPITRRLRPERLLQLTIRWTPSLLRMSRVAGRVPVLGRKLRYLIPVVNYEGVYPLSEEQLREWAILDTFDMLAPAHDHPQSASMLREWLNTAGLEAIYVKRHGHLVGRGSKPAR